ncbi:hypothetical protein [Streptococcus constellatus]|uniref:hypothetical protein n=1 Tax=Streptococcus constellatus TaxID=76860 RepID=UPI00066B612F|nr:hypothetical protein [Streptococcus constellatus]
MSKTALIIAGVVVAGVTAYTVKKLKKRKSETTDTTTTEESKVSVEQEDFVNSEVDLNEIKNQVQQSGEEQSTAIKNRHQEANAVMKSSLETIFNDNTETTSPSTFKQMEDDLEDLLK